MRNLRKNKFVILAICVIVVSIAYFSIQKIIDNSIENNNIISANEESVLEEAFVKEEKNETISEREKKEKLQEETNLVREEAEEEVSADTASENEKIYVYITGEVNIPGVVILNEGSRIVDAINSAGGTTDKADISKINLVYVLDDGMKVNIPNKEDLKNNPNFEYIISSSGEGAKNDVSNDMVVSSETISSDRSSLGSNYVVNINTATQTELESLPGIGPSLALKIINYRKENGKFSSIDDIKNVSGIGEKKFEELKKYITI